MLIQYFYGGGCRKGCKVYTGSDGKNSLISGHKLNLLSEILVEELFYWTNKKCGITTV